MTEISDLKANQVHQLFWISCSFFLPAQNLFLIYRTKRSTSHLTKGKHSLAWSYNICIWLLICNYQCIQDFKPLMSTCEASAVLECIVLYLPFFHYLTMPMLNRTLPKHCLVSHVVYLIIDIIKNQYRLSTNKEFKSTSDYFFFKETSLSYYFCLRRWVKFLILSSTSMFYINFVLFCDFKWYNIDPVRHSLKANKTKALLVIWFYHVWFR